MKTQRIQLLSFLLLLNFTYIVSQNLALYELEGLPDDIQIQDVKYHDGMLYVAGGGYFKVHDLSTGWLNVVLPSGVTVEDSLDYGDTFDMNDWGQAIVRMESATTRYFGMFEGALDNVQLMENTLQRWGNYMYSKPFYIGRDSILITMSSCTDYGVPLSIYSTDAGSTWTELGNECVPVDSDFVKIGNVLHWYGDFYYYRNPFGPETFYLGHHQMDLTDWSYSFKYLGEITDANTAPFNVLAHSIINPDGSIYYSFEEGTSEFNTYGSTINSTDDPILMGKGPGGRMKKGFNNTGYFLISDLYDDDDEWLASGLFYRLLPEDDFNPVQIENLNHEIGKILDIVQEKDGDGLFFVTEHKVYYTSSITGYDNSIVGDLYIDKDGDCALGMDDTRFPDRLIQLSYTDDRVISIYTNDGQVDFGIPQGEGVIDVSGVNDELWELCTDDLNFDATSPGVVIFDVGYTAINECNYVGIYGVAEPLGKCFESTYYIRLVNEGSLVTEPSTLNLELPDELIFKSATVSHSTGVGNMYELDIPALDLFEELMIEVVIEVDCMAEDELEVCIISSMNFDDSCEEPSNINTYCSRILSSYDPNQMTVYNTISAQDTFFTKVDSQLYKIDFQNTGTFAAKTVRLETRISEDLDLRTFKFLGSSHEADIQFYNERTLVVTFENINLPDSTANLAESQGAFMYRIEPMDDVAEDTRIYSHADIYFDYNLPIRTNDALAWIDKLGSGSTIGTLSFNVYPNPTSGEIWIDGLDSNDGHRYELMALDGSIIELGDLKTGGNLLDLSSYTKGLYFIRIISGKGDSGVSKVIKN